MYRAPLIVALGGLLLAVAGCSNPAPAPAAVPAAPAASAPAEPAQAVSQPAAVSATAVPERAAIKIGVTPLLTVSGLYVALDRGYFAEQGIDVAMENITDPTTMVPSLATGQIDVGNGAMSAGLWNALARGADLRLVALQSYIPPGIEGAGYVVRKADLDNGLIGDYPTLKGKRVSNNGTGNYTQIVLGKAAEKGGLTLADVEIVDMGQPDAILALANGSIDIATLSEPIRTATLAQSWAAQWKDYSEISPGQQATAWVYSAPFATERPDVGRRTIVALLRGIRELYGAFNRDVNRDEIVDIVMRYLAVRDRSQYNGVHAQVSPNGDFDVPRLQGDVDWYVANGFSPQRVDVSRAIDPTFIEYALQQLGRY